MCVYGIDEIIDMLDWRNSKEIQSAGITAGRSAKCIKAFFQPLSDSWGKNVWENCARIVCSHTDEELNRYVVDMLLWIQDLNWPGALMIMGRLQQFTEVTILTATVTQMLPALIALEETTWLNNIANLMDSQLFATHIDTKTFCILAEFRAAI